MERTDIEKVKEWVDAGKVREILEPFMNSYEGDAPQAIRDIINLLPTPPLPTLDDMDKDARRAMIGKDVKVEGWNNPSMLIAVHKNEGAVLGHSWVNPWPFVEVRPLSQLTPADTAPDQAVAKDICNNEEESLPRPEDVPSGEAWLVRYKERELVAYKADRSSSEQPWVVYLSYKEDYWWLGDSDITLISRLVPERKENA